MSLKVGELHAVLGLNKTAFDSGLQSARASFGKLADQAGALGKSLTMKVTMPLVGIAAAATKMGADFQKQMNRVAALTQATGADFTALEDKAKELGRTTVFSASQSADAMGFLAMAGFEANQIIEAMPSVLQLAAAAQIDLARAADITSNILTGYGMSVSELAHANDVLVKAMTSTNVDLNMLGESFKYAGPLAKAAGMAFEEAAAAIGMMGNAGIQGSMAGTALRGAITRLLKPTKEVSEYIAKLGLSTTDSQGKLLPLVDIIEQLEKKGASAADIMGLFGTRAGPAMAALVDQGADALRHMTEQLGSAGGIAERIAKQQLEGLHGAITLMKSAIEGAAITLADQFMPHVEKAANWIAVMAGRFAELPPHVVENIVKIAALVATMGPALLIFSKLAKLVLFLTSPIGLAVGAAVALGVAFGVTAQGIWDALGSVWEGVQTVFGRVQDAFSWFKDHVLAFLVVGWKSGLGEAGDDLSGWAYTVGAVLGQVKEIIGVVLGWARAFWETWGERLVAVGKSTWDKIKTIVKAALDVVRGLLDMVIGLITGDWERFSDGLKRVWSGLWTGIKAIVEGAWDLLKTAFEVLWSYISGWFSSLVTSAVDWGKNVITGFIDGVKSMFSPARKAIADTTAGVESAARAELEIQSPSRVFRRLGEQVSLGLAEGIKSAASQVQAATRQAMPAPAAAGAPGGRAMGEFTVHVHLPPGMSAEQATRAGMETGNALMRVLRQNGLVG